jgi:hypothetical protein
LTETLSMKSRSRIDTNSCSCLSFCSALFLMKLLPSRASLCFRLQIKETNYHETYQENNYIRRPAI